MKHRIFQNKLVYRMVILTTIAVFVVALLSVNTAGALTFHSNRLIDDQVFDRSSSMSASQIDTWLNNRYGSTSCISTAHGFSAPDPIGYSPSAGFKFGGNVSAGRVIYDAAQAYGINPQVLLVTLQKEQSLVSGTAGCSVLRYSGAMGYGCPDGGTTHNYSGVNLYSIHGVAVTSVSGTCVNSSLKVGFSQQVIRGAWLLKFGQQRSKGNIGWAVIKGNWDNSDDPLSCYGGPMTQGTFKTCPGGSATYFDGYTSIDGSAVHMDTGGTASLYWYTPHIHGNQLFFSTYSNWFGVPLVGQNMPSCQTDSSKITCVWQLNYRKSSDIFFTSSASERDNLVYFNKFKYSGIAFFSGSSSAADTVAVYRLYNSHIGRHFWTAGINEKNALVSRGYRFEGVAFYGIQKTSSRVGDPVYRILDSRTGAHIWTTSSAKKNALVLNSRYRYEGISFYSAAAQVVETTPATGYKNVYRFYGLPGGEHFWTAGIRERDWLLKAGYTYEGVGWATRTASSTRPIYRLYNSHDKSHFWTASATEKTSLEKKGFQYEGIVLYASPTATGSSVFRLYNSHDGKHFWTSSLNERNSLVTSHGFRYEGVAWYN